MSTAGVRGCGCAKSHPCLSVRGIVHTWLLSAGFVHFECVARVTLNRHLQVADLLLGQLVELRHTLGNQRSSFDDGLESVEIVRHQGLTQIWRIGATAAADVAKKTSASPYLPAARRGGLIDRHLGIIDWDNAKIRSWQRR